MASKRTYAYGNFRLMLDFLEERGIISPHRRKKLHEYTTKSDNSKVYALARDYIVHTYYEEKAKLAEAHKNIS